MNNRRFAFLAAAALIGAIASPAFADDVNQGKMDNGKFNPYSSGAHAFNIYAEGAKSQFNIYSEGAKGEFNVYSEGALASR
jgi:hypothetical protein